MEGGGQIECQSRAQYQERAILMSGCKYKCSATANELDDVLTYSPSSIVDPTPILLRGRAASDNQAER